MTIPVETAAHPRTLDAGLFATEFAPFWYETVRDARHGGVFERIAKDGRAAESDPKTTLAQARTVFALAHLHLQTGDARLLAAALDVYRFLDDHLCDGDGGYRFAVCRDGQALADPATMIRRTYDQSFALLALITLGRASPETVPQSRIDSCWAFIDGVLTDPADGSLWESDLMAGAGPGPDELRSQNPHMHMFEALLQAFEMTGEAVWLDRATALYRVALRAFIDPATGAVREFVGPDLAPIDNADGQRREPGHQYEWAWLLHRFADFGGEPGARDTADAMLGFVERFGVRRAGPMAGAVHDALDAHGTVVEDTHLLWPLTEAGKLHAALFLATGDDAHAVRARALKAMIFDRYFAPAGTDGPPWVNRIDGQGLPLWSEALSRLLYHVALFVTEGERAGLWPRRCSGRAA